MAGGLLNIYAVSSANVIIHGTPSKTFFKATYSKITNFGLQKFRLDFEGARDIRLTTESTFSFKMKRYADLLMDTYVCITLPDIWSPIYYRTNAELTAAANSAGTVSADNWIPYEFRWIKNIGTQIIKSIEITCGAMSLQKYSGEYILAAVSRDMPREKKELFDVMTGNVPELTDPANAHGRLNTYPNAYYTDAAAGAEPSIRARELCVPLTAWFTGDSRCALPLIALQYAELVITVTLRPVQELMQVRDVFDWENGYPYIQPDFNSERFQMYRFLQTPPAIVLSESAYTNTTRVWNADVHLTSTYCFLSNEESAAFAAEDQMYLVKDVVEYNFNNVIGATKVRLMSSGLVTNWMFHLRRNDANLRNEWSNYTNWPYATVPQPVQFAATTIADTSVNSGVGPYFQSTGDNSGLYVTGDYSTDNTRHVLRSMGILLDGEYRENAMTRAVYDYIEKYARTRGCAPEGQYCYNFGINTTEYQPSGALNMSKFKLVELEVVAHTPVLSTAKTLSSTCDNQVSFSDMPTWRLYDYAFDLIVYEERYNVLTFVGGSCGMMYAK
jgi:hypothetical protein